MSEASIETVTALSPLNPVGLGITNNQEIKNQFFLRSVKFSLLQILKKKFEGLLDGRLSDSYG